MTPNPFSSIPSIILHIDMNSYFASVEQQANPFLRGKPIGITGKHQERSIIATASIEAKRLGVKTAMSTWEAKQICPSLILYPGDPEKYSDITRRFNATYREFTDRVESFSVDESFLDLSERTPDYFGAACIALTIRQRLKEELGEYITASIGIAPNKLMAKLSSESVKPNGLTVTPPQQVLNLLDRSALQDLCGIGPCIEQRLNALGIFTFKQLRTFSLPIGLLLNPSKITASGFMKQLTGETEWMKISCQNHMATLTLCPKIRTIQK
ncbi:DNA polymerase IV [Candidatus Uhrbacteria bacterium]|nr:DNA polymerase IV [Candidatus Uhrbacteria bacterium]